MSGYLRSARSWRHGWCAVLVAVIAACAVSVSGSAQAPAPVSSIRMHVIDMGGRPPGPRESTYPAWLVVHPKGTLLFEAGALPDAYVNTDRNREELRDALRTIVTPQPLKTKLKELGYTPDRITFFAMSHYHDDHTGNANDFANGSTAWLVQRRERDAMFAEKPPDIGDIRTTNALRDYAKTIVIENKDHDVFGDGSVMLIYTPGHTPGHQSLFVRLPKTGLVIVTGDLYASSAQRVPPYDQMPAFNTSKEETIASRVKLEELAKKTNGNIWVHHDVPTIKGLKKSPEYYE